MSEKSVRRSASGSPIYRYGARTKPFEMATDNPDMERIQQHVERHIEEVATVYHELISDLVHVDIFWIKPTPDRNFHTLITSGMSARPMKAPPQAQGFQYAELLICLPPEWPLSEEAFRDEQYYWPIRQLKMLARLPHEYDTWLWYAHTVPNGDPPAPYAKNTQLSGIIVAIPLSVPEDFLTLEVSADKVIHFFSVVPLYREEMDFKLRRGAEALFELLDRQGVNELLDIRRSNVCKKSIWPFG